MLQWRPRMTGDLADCPSRPTLEVEEFGLAENLMIEIAVMESGFAVVRRAVPPGAEMTDLAGFEACLSRAKAALALA